MLQYKDQFDKQLGIKKYPNDHEKQLFHRAQKYIKKIAHIPWIEMIAVVNSLSMYATHKDSDIDLFIITKPRMIWFVRFFSTFIFWLHWVWRKNKDVRENFCLSFFITTESMDLDQISIQNDIYLYYWIYYMKPIVCYNDAYNIFINQNKWVTIDEEQKKINIQYIQDTEPYKPVLQSFYKIIDSWIRSILKKKTIKTHANLWYPKGIIINDTMLKFHNNDARERIRDTIFKKNFDK